MHTDTKEPRQKLEAALKEAGWLTENESTVHLLDAFPRLVGRATKTSGAEYFWNIFYFSWCVTSVARPQQGVGSRTSQIFEQAW